MFSARKRPCGHPRLKYERALRKHFVLNILFPLLNFVSHAVLHAALPATLLEQELLVLPARG